MRRPLARPPISRGRLPGGWVEGAIGTLVLLVAWQVLASYVLGGRHVVPAPSQVLTTLVQDHFYWASLRVTLWEAARGWAIGNFGALALAGVALFVPRLSRVFQQLGAITYCVPTVAIGPLILVFSDPDTAKVAISALSVFFVSLIAWMTGLRAADQACLDLVHAYGGGRACELFRVRLRAAMPSAAGGLALSAPAAILGAIIGEYLGGVSGLGVAMVSAEESFQVSQTWAIGLLATAVSGLAYSTILVLAKRFGGDPQVGTSGASPAPPGAARARGLARVRPLFSPLAALVVVVACWALALKLFGLSPYLAKSPSAVLSFLVSAPGAAANRAVIFNALATTLRDAMLGWLLGTATALIGAAALTQLPRLRAGIMPVVMTLRSVPLIAMTPLIALVFGQGVLGVTIVAAVVTFVPSLVLVTSGLQSAPPQAVELGRAYNISSLGLLVRIRSRYATPSLFAAAKVAMPGAILGAVLAEWLLTGSGIGHLMAVSLIGSDFNTLWASVVVVSGVSLALYELVGVLETAAAKRFAA